MTSSITIVIPTYNERANLESIVTDLHALLPEGNVVVVDDNSPDGTAGVAKQMARQFPNVRCLHRIGRRGLSSAVVEGISASAAPYFAVIDADLQHDESVLPKMYERAVAGDDVVVGTRYAGDGEAAAGFSTAGASAFSFAAAA